MTATTSLAIRRAGPDDAAALSRLAAQTFSQAFGHLYPAVDLADFLRESYSIERQATILSHPRYAVWFLEDAGTPVGHVAAGPCGLPHREVGAADGEIKRLYVLASHQNGGWGGRLFDTAVQWLQCDGPRTLWVGVWSGNPGAQRFYARQGFRHVGDYEFPVGRVRDHEFILRRPAGDA
ncbi:GNAT family N-acetyltransferase [Lysobacter sp. A3-1-A15]|uniref:GNAT family N-acetyltransferase n=1 Tax=Novilysobacter viscosus TaxID=3098602 RepID=UPI002EDA248C